MASALNHMKRSHRSTSKHLYAAHMMPKRMSAKERRDQVAGFFGRRGK